LGKAFHLPPGLGSLEIKGEEARRRILPAVTSDRDRATGLAPLRSAASRASKAPAGQPWLVALLCLSISGQA